MALKRPKGRPERIGKLLASSSSVLSNRLQDLEIWQCWDVVVGSAIAARAYPLRLQNQVLTVMVSNGPWMQQLSFMKRELVEKINTQLGNERVKEIVLKVGKPLDRPTTASEPRPEPRELSAEEVAEIRQRASGIEDEELCLAFQELMKTHLKNR